MKIASWNINSVRFRAAIVEQFLKEAAPDVLCLQETKVVDDDFPFEMFRSLGYEHIIIHGQRMHHGVAIVAKVPITEDDRLDWQANAEARHVGIRCRAAYGWRMSISRRAATCPIARRIRNSARSSISSAA